MLFLAPQRIQRQQPRQDHLWCSSRATEFAMNRRLKTKLHGSYLIQNKPETPYCSVAFGSLRYTTIYTISFGALDCYLLLSTRFMMLLNKASKTKVHRAPQSPKRQCSYWLQDGLGPQIHHWCTNMAWPSTFSPQTAHKRSKSVYYFSFHRIGWG